MRDPRVPFYVIYAAYIIFYGLSLVWDSTQLVIPVVFQPWQVSLIDGSSQITMQWYYAVCVAVDIIGILISIYGFRKMYMVDKTDPDGDGGDLYL